MWHIYVATDEVIVKIEPGYLTRQDAEKAVKDFFTNKNIIWARYNDGSYGEMDTWRAFDIGRCRWCHVAPNGAYTVFVEGKYT